MSVHTRVPENINYAIIPVEGYHIYSWCPLPDGKGPSTQVHWMLRLPGARSPIVLRLKSRRAVEELIKTLTFHMNDVWPANDQE